MQQAWPNLSYSLHDQMSASLFRETLRSRMKAFVSGISEPFDYENYATAGFNSWIRHEIPYYSSYGQIATLNELPLVTKADRRLDPTSFSNSRTDLGPVYVKRTTGTTGAPMTFPYSAAFSHETIHLAIPKIARRLELRPTEDQGVFSVTVRDKPNEEPTVRFDPSGHGGAGMRVGVDTASESAINDAIARLAAVRPFCISSGPSVLAALADVVEPEVARDMGVRLIVSGGSALPDALRERLVALFGVAVVTAYGLSEFGVVASECIHGHLHFNTSECLPEVLPLARDAIADAGRPLLDDEGEIVISAIGNRLSPFLRYRTGDIGRLVPAPCPCGEPSPRLELKLGRTVPTFKLPSGARFSPTQFRDAFELFPTLKEFQATQEKIDLVVLRLEFHAGVSDAEDQSRLIAADFSSRLGPGVSVRPELHQFVDTFKFQRYISLVD